MQELNINDLYLGLHWQERVLLLAVRPHVPALNVEICPSNETMTCSFIQMSYYYESAPKPNVEQIKSIQSIKLL